MRIRTFALMAVCLFAAGQPLAFALDRSEVLFYAGFEDTLTADIAEGKAEPLSEDDSTFAEGIIGKGVLPGSRITYDYEGNINPREATISFWIKPLDWGTSDLKAGQYNFFTVHGSPAMQITHVYWGVVRFYMYYPRETNATNVHTYYGFVKNRWYHFAATWKSGEEAQFFINGSRIGKITENVTTVQGGSNFSIGAPRTVFDELMVFKRALKYEEVLTLFFRGLQR